MINKIENPLIQKIVREMEKDSVEFFKKAGRISEVILSQFEQKGIAPGSAAYILQMCILKIYLSENLTFRQVKELCSNISTHYEEIKSWKNSN